MAHITEHFTWHDALWLPKWGRLATVADGLTDVIKERLVNLYTKMEVVREFLGAPIIVHVTFRPTAYNTLIKGATNSAHLFGQAVDWHAEGMTCDNVRTLIVPKLEEWDMRCENLAGSTWVHLDTRQPVKSRYFCP